MSEGILDWFYEGRPKNEEWILCAYADEDGFLHYDAGLYFEGDDVLLVDFEEASFSTPFSEYLKWTRIEEY